MKDRFADRAAQWHFDPRITAMFRAFKDLFHKEISLTPDMVLLDVGGGTGLNAFEFAESVRSVTIVDSSPAMAKTARERIEAEGIKNCFVSECDIVHAEFPANSFDLIYGHMSFHHIESIGSAVLRCRDFLVPGGMLVIADLSAEDGSFHGDDPVPHNGFNPAELKALLESHGFEQVRTVPLESVSRPETGRIYERFFMSARKA